MDRKDFFQEAWNSLFKNNKYLTAIEKLGKLSYKSNPPIKKQRPPGASTNDKEFRDLCTGCDACMVACPVNVIMIEDLERRYPVIYPEKDPCIHCAGYPCIQACPTSALHYNEPT